MGQPLSVTEVWHYPTTRLDYTFDFSGELDTDTISSATWTAIDAGPTIDGTSNTTTTASAFLTGGTAGSDYRVQCSVSTAGGRTIVRRMTLHVR